MVRNIALFPVYWLLTVTAQLARVLGFVIGAVAGVLAFSVFATLPPQSGVQALVLIALCTGVGIYGSEQIGARFAGAVRRIAERLERGHRVPPFQPWV